MHGKYNPEHCLYLKKKHKKHRNFGKSLKLVYWSQSPRRAELPWGSSVGSWRVCINQQSGNQKGTWDFGSSPAPKGCLTLFTLSQGPGATRHPLQIPCESCSGLDFLLWEGCPAATLPFHIQGQLCWVRPKASNISPRQIPRKESKNRESNSLRHPHESVTPRLPEPEVVLLNMALHGTLFHWVI